MSRCSKFSGDYITGQSRQQFGFAHAIGGDSKPETTINDVLWQENLDTYSIITRRKFCLVGQNLLSVNSNVESSFLYVLEQKPLLMNISQKYALFFTSNHGIT